MIQKITQSFMKDMREYFAGRYCGNLVQRKYVEDTLLEDKTKSMAEGSYFEFCLTGATPKDGKVPQPVMMASDSKKPYVQYRRAKYNADLVKAMMAEMGLKIVEVGKKKHYGRFEGTIDIVCECTKALKFEDGTEWKVGDRIIIDMKYSGLIYDRWEKHGWMWSEIQKEYHGTQAKHYSMVGKLPFYFWVVQNNNPEDKENGGFIFPDMEFFWVDITEEQKGSHVMEANELYERFLFDAKIGFTARPSLKACRKCSLRENCVDKQLFPHPKRVDLTPMVKI